MLQLGSKCSENTMRFLLEVSKHLSWRKECKDRTYYLTIKDDGSVEIVCKLDEFLILEAHHLFLFRDTHHRSEWDKILIVDHVILDHLPDLRSADTGAVRLDTSKVFPGKYMYVPSFGGHRRKWVRLQVR